jgi:hypothetical protein
MATTASTVLLENGSATGPWLYFPGGIATIAIQANFGAGNVAVEYLMPDGATALSLTGSITANTLVRSANAQLHPPGRYRAVVSGGATAVWVRMDRVPS